MIFKKKRKKRIKSKDWYDFHEPFMFGTESIADRKVNQRFQKGLCRGCGKLPNICSCKSSERI